MQNDFQSALTEAQLTGGERVWQLIWRELSQWHGSVLQEHLRAGRTLNIDAMVYSTPELGNEMPVNVNGVFQKPPNNII